jgi:two-component system cell cycle sensor histidine kinase/response regulator CckA
MSDKRLAQYRFMFEASRSGLAMVGLDGCPEHWNPALERILGYAGAELRRTPILDAATDNTTAEASLFRELIRGDRSRYEIEKTYRHKDGRTVWTRLAAATMRDENGVLECVVCRIDDLTEQREAARERAQLRETAKATEDRLLLALSAASMGVWEWNFTTNAVTWSEGLERIAGLQPGTFGGTLDAFLAIVNKEDNVTANAALRAAIESGTDEFESEFRLRRPDGSVRWVATRGRVLRTDGRPEHVLGVALDVSNLRQLETRFHQAQKMEAMGRLAGGVAHDFNNLLTAISGYGEFVFNKLEPDDQRRADVQEILNAAERATSLTRQLLAFSRKQVLSARVINPNVIVAGMEKMLRRIIGSDIEMRVVLDPGTGAVRVDPSQLEQVIMNLAVNARDAMPNGGVLTVETSAVAFDEPFHEFGIDLQPGRYAVLAVGDTGFGMTPETKARLFEPFFTTKDEGRGTGLGLATVLGIVQQSGGAIWVQSSPGEGAVFKVYLPWVSAQAEPPSSVWSESTSVHGNEIVLLVDDDVHVRALGERALVAHGYRVFAFESGPEALEFVAGSGIQPNVLITDIVMPKMSGPELANRLREIVRSVTVLYITGYTDRAIEQGGTPDILQKPFSPSTLLRTVRDLLDRWLRD